MGKKTLIDLDRELTEQAQRILGGATIKDAVHEALRRVVAEQALDELAAWVGDRTPAERDLLARVRDEAW